MAIEFALVAPILLVLVFGIIEYGVMLSFRQGVSQSAAEGARAAATTLPGGDAIANAEQAVAAAIGHGITCDGTNLKKGTTYVGNCDVSEVACSSIASGPAATAGTQCYQVDIKYDYHDNPLVPLLPFIPMPDELSYTGVSEVSS